jgi:rhomboid protease GluP
MSDQWDRKDYIEGQYEVLEERDVREEQGGSHTPEQNSFLHMDTRPPYVTYVFLGMNIVAYLLMSAAGWFFNLNQSQQLFIFGAKYNTLIAYGQYWRLFTAMFLHIGIMHLFFNSYALYAYGPVVEHLFGKAKFAAVYLLSGLMGSLFSYIFSPNPAAGASGAIFGLMGSLLYFRQRRKDIFRRIFGAGLMMIIGINLFYGMVQPGIDNWGHIGGLAGGYLVGNAIGLYKEKRFDLKKLLICALIAVIFLFGLWYGQQKYTVRTLPPLPQGRDSLQLNYPMAHLGYKVEQQRT